MGYAETKASHHQVQMMTFHFSCWVGGILDSFLLACKKGELGAPLPCLLVQAPEMASASSVELLDVPEAPGPRPQCPVTQTRPVGKEGGVFWEAGPHCLMCATHWEVP